MFFTGNEADVRAALKKCLKTAIFGLSIQVDTSYT